MSLPGLALASSRSLLELAEAGSDLTWDSCWAVLTEAAPATKTLPKPDRMSQKNLIAT